MSVQIEIIHAGKFIQATPEGQLGIEEARTLFSDINLASDNLQKYNTLIDTRKAHSVMSVFDLWYLASELYKYVKTYSRKIAILYAPDNFNNVDFFSLCSHNRGFNVKAFTSHEETMAWIIEGQVMAV